MKLDDNDPLYSEWSNGWRPSAGTLPAATSLSPHALQLDEPESYPQTSPEHRARLRRYVKVTVAGCMALCTAAMVRVAVSHMTTASESGSPSSRTAAVQVAKAHTQPPPPPEPPPAAVAAAVVPARSVAAAATSSPTKTAVRDREAARRALEGGKPKDAVAAAERATATDPGDAEAWLILGAAHGELGHAAAARDAFRSCAKSAKRGPVRECAAMLR